MQVECIKNKLFCFLMPIVAIEQTQAAEPTNIPPWLILQNVGYDCVNLFENVVCPIT